jgi:hypothetical protein
MGVFVDLRLKSMTEEERLAWLKAHRPQVS